MDAFDRQLLNAMQEAVPLVSRPFAALGRPLGLGEQQVLERIRRLKDKEVIRQIGPVFSSRRLGYQSTLAAFHVRRERLDNVAQIVSAHPGVSHNYSRNHFYNLWFTLTLPRNRDLEAEIRQLASTADVTEYVNLPSLRRFKLGVHFDMSEKREIARTDAKATGAPSAAPERQPPDGGPSLTAFERDVVRAIQGDLLLVRRPFAHPAAGLGVREERLLTVARDLDERGIMRRFSAVLKHRRAGFTANGMGCWVLPSNRIVEAGQTAATFRAVSHCYQRAAHPPRWPYNLFTMVHGQTEQEVEETVAHIEDAIAPIDYTILYSQKEYKKQRVRYFLEAHNVDVSNGRRDDGD